MENKNLSIQDLKDLCKKTRLKGLEMTMHSANGAHLGGSFSCTEILAVLYGRVLRFDINDPENPNRDIFMSSKQHFVLSFLPILAHFGFFSEEELLNFQKDDGLLTGYPKNIKIGHEYSGGTLGVAISVQVGLALAGKEDKKNNNYYVLLGDAELNEGSNWEAFMSAAHFKLDNLVVIIDRNHLSYDGNTEDVMGLGNLSDKMKSFGWHVVECNGHDVEDLIRAFKDKEKDKPTVIIADTIKGKGVSFMESVPKFHHSKLTQEQYEKAKAEIEGAE